MYNSREMLWPIVQLAEETLVGFLGRLNVDVAVEHFVMTVVIPQ